MSGDSSATDSTPARPRWYVPTANKFLAIVLLMQGILFLSVQTCWFWFNGHKGYTVLITVAATAFGLLFMAAWGVVGRLFRSKVQFGLATLLWVVSVVAFPCGWLAREMDQARQQRELVATLRERGIQVSYYGPSPDELGPTFLGPSVRAYLVSALGHEFFTNVAHVEIFRANDGDLEIVKRFTELRFLSFHEAQITDAGLEYLQGLSQLQNLVLNATNLSDAGLERLGELAPLTSLTINGGGITDGGLLQLKRLKKLQALRLRGVAVTDAGLERLGEFRQLTLLDLAHTQVTDDGMKKLREALPNCRIYRR